MVTQVFGVRGNYGDLEIEPKLSHTQFSDGQASIQSTFRRFDLATTYFLDSNKDYGEYKIVSYTLNGAENRLDQPTGVLELPYELLETHEKDGKLNLEIFLE